MFICNTEMTTRDELPSKTHVEMRTIEAQPIKTKPSDIVHVHDIQFDITRLDEFMEIFLL
jgi:hypothetical protein